MRAKAFLNISRPSSGSLLMLSSKFTEQASPRTSASPGKMTRRSKFPKINFFTPCNVGLLWPFWRSLQEMQYANCLAVWMGATIQSQRHRHESEIVMTVMLKTPFQIADAFARYLPLYLRHTLLRKPVVAGRSVSEILHLGPPIPCYAIWSPAI